MEISSQDLQFLVVYLNLVETVNRKIMLMYGIKIMDSDAFSKYYYLVDEFCDAFFRITGFEKDIKTNVLVTNKSNGILSVNSITAIYDSYIEIDGLLKKYPSLIDHLKLYRNKAQHNPQLIGFDSLMGGSINFDIVFSYKSKRYTLCSTEIRKMVMDLNIIISRIVVEVWKRIDEKKREDICSLPSLEALFSSKKYDIYNDFLMDDNKGFIIDLFDIV